MKMKSGMTNILSKFISAHKRVLELGHKTVKIVKFSPLLHCTLDKILVRSLFTMIFSGYMHIYN